MRTISDAVQGDPKALTNVLRLLKAFPLPIVDKNRNSSPVDHATEVRGKIEDMVRNVAGNAGRFVGSSNERPEREA